jgi:ribosomal protein S18 acetylase RimI-like enzyme
VTTSTELGLRDATSDDLPAIARLRESVGWPVNEWALRAVVGTDDACCCVATDVSGEVVAVGSGIIYGPLGFIGNMIVASSHRRRGLGSAILVVVSDFLEHAGCRRLELNATSEGRLLYERHGFASTGTSATARLRREHLPPASRQSSARDGTPGDLEALATYDRPRFGGDRRRLLARLLADPACRFFVAQEERAITGYACLRTDQPRIGPLVADGTVVAEALLARVFQALPEVGDLRLNLPPGNRVGAAWLAGLGVEIEPWDGRMARGEPIERREETLYGMTVGALG